MSCYRPLTAFQEAPGGSLRFMRTDRNVRYQYDPPGRELQIPCGRCVGCRQSRARQWSMRCMHEASLHDSSVFVTLTYDDAHCPVGLEYDDYRAFMRRLRQYAPKVRFYVCGEYGDVSLRPHFHALLFGCFFPDASPIGKDLFRSRILESLWTFGISSFGSVSPASALYVASYSVNAGRSPRFRVDPGTGEFVGVRPAFGRMSLRPGLGFGWFARYWQEVYGPRDAVVRVGGSAVPPPRYYDKLLGALDASLREEKELTRYLSSQNFVADSSPARLLDREICALAKQQSSRSL